MSTSPLDLIHPPIDIVMTSWNDNSLYTFNNLSGHLMKLDHFEFKFYQCQTILVSDDLFIFSDDAMKYL